MGVVVGNITEPLKTEHDDKEIVCQQRSDDEEDRAEYRERIRELIEEDRELLDELA